ncbi:serine hydrolase [Microbulbifer sp. THAF38]|uniref:serine hydrolase domain-containing protein n=1 Tax=Microbulbifer sp. THAF38 TaxID=2587856 RepID=UPI0012696088|nr:serine hydrolase domain-containing protein [Microbulbifer sp. THAF38]QFT52972.1 Penicillin-binding protein 4* [Microbulbifer sp. THAF38]
MKNKKFVLGIFALLSCIGYLLWPVYQFYAWSLDALPLSPFGWQALATEAPSTHKIYRHDLKEAADQSLKVIETHRQEIGSPAISAAVSACGKLVWAGASGWADLEKQIPVTTETRFRIGSTSKALTGTALARLVQKGSIDLDKSITHYLEALPNQEWAEITPRQLASHMSGLPHYKKNSDWLGLYKTLALDRHYDSMYQALEIFDSSELLFQPGSNFYYSTLGTVLLGAVLAGAEQKSYLDVMEDEVFIPAGMKNTGISPLNGNMERNIARFYKSNGLSGDELRLREWRPVDLSHRLPGGGFISTPTDLVKLGAHYLDDNFLAAETREAFWTPQKLANGEVNEQHYALGWRYREQEIPSLGIVRHANHGGVSRGSQSWLMVIPDHNLSVALNINRKTKIFWDFGRISMDIAEAFIRQQDKLGCK